MKYKKRNLLVLKKKHIVIISVILAVLIAVLVIVKVSEAGRVRAEKEQAVASQIHEGLLRVGLRGDIGQFCTLNPDTGEYEGLEKDVIDELISRIFGDDILVQYVDVNSRTKDALLKIGDIDVSLGASINTDQSGICYTDSYFADACAFLVMEGGITSQTGLSGGIIAVVQKSLPAQDSEVNEDKTLLDDYLAAQGIAATVKSFASYPEAVDALKSGVVEGVCASENDLKLFGKSGMLLLADRFIPNRYCLQFASGDSALCAAFTDAINDMIKDGTMAALITKWNLVDYSALPDVNGG